MYWFQGKCYDHGGWDKRVYGEKCPCCTGRIGRKKQKPEKDNE